MTGSDLPTAKSSRSAHKSKHNEKTVIFPLFCNKSQTPSAFTCSPGFGCVIPTIPEVCDWKVPPNYSWCSSSLSGEIGEVDYEYSIQRGENRVSDPEEKKKEKAWRTDCDLLKCYIFFPSQFKQYGAELSRVAEIGLWKKRRGLDENVLLSLSLSLSLLSLSLPPSSLSSSLSLSLLPPSRQTHSHSWSLALLFHTIFPNPTLDSDPSKSVH